MGTGTVMGGTGSPGLPAVVACWTMRPACRAGLRPRRSRVQRYREMVRRDVHSLSQVEPVGAVTLPAAVEVKLIATERSRLLDEPVEQHATVSGGPLRRGCHEVVDVHRPSPCEHLEDAKPGHGHDLTVVLDERDPVALTCDSICRLTCARKADSSRCGRSSCMTGKPRVGRCRIGPG